MFKIKIQYNSLKLQIIKNNNKLFLQKQENIISIIILKDIYINIQDNLLFLESKNLINIKLQKKLIDNNILGLMQGFKIKLNLIGIGYKYFIKLNKIYFKLNKSHLIYFNIPKIIQVYQIQGSTLLLTSVNFNELTLFIKKLKSIIKPNIYKKKGIFFSTEIPNIKKKK